MDKPTCSVDGCDKPTKSRGWCQAHYFRWRRNGSVGSPVVRGRGVARCSVDGCDKSVRGGGRGWCNKHYRRWKSTGDPLGLRPTVGPTRWRVDVPSYSGAHDRVANLRGPASTHVCVQCGAPAKQWAYDHADPNERASDLGPYSADPEHYMPMCVPCHKRLDLARLAAREVA